MPTYIWQLSNWPRFRWDENLLLPLLSMARLKQGKLMQKMQSLLQSDRTRAQAQILEEEALKTARIEGEAYQPESVRSSIHRRLGLEYALLPRTQRHIEGLVDVLFDATLHFRKPLTQRRLCSWQAALFPTGYSGLLKISPGKFRTDATGPMQVISGSLKRHRVHFQAPPARKIPREIDRFLMWWTKSEKTVDGIIRAAIAHMYFVTIHPFEDGNGRIARALTDMALAQDDHMTNRYFSLSREILKEKKAYYQILERTQKGDLDITTWLIWFLTCFINALDASELLLKNIFVKTAFWQTHQAVEVNVRQRKVLNALLDAGQGEFVGGLTTRKYVGMTRVSRPTAVREINDLVAKKLLLRDEEDKGRNVHYEVNVKSPTQTR